MNETEIYILNAIRKWVWSGFYSPDQVDSMIDDILEDGVDEHSLRSAIAPEFKKKATEEQKWPKETDCDRLDKAFDALHVKGICALHNAGYEMSDGYSEVAEVVHGKDNYQGYCFYHGQDVEGAMEGHGLMIAFGHLNDDPTRTVEIGKAVSASLEAAGLEVVWDSSAESRIEIPKFQWKRRYAA
jgi:hypothetical protein